MRSKELSAGHRALLFSSLSNMENWDKIGQLLFQGEQAAKVGEMPELAEQFEQGRDSILEAMKNSKQFLPWEFELMQLGLAAGNIKEVYERIHQHYLLQQQMFSQLRKELRLPSVILISVLLSIVGMSVYNGDINWLSASVQLLVFGLIAWLVLLGSKWLFVNFSAGQIPEQLSTVIKRLPGINRLLSTLQTYHFFTNLSLCIRSGINLKQSLKLSAKRIPDSYFYPAYAEISQQVADGQKLSVTLSKSGVLKGVNIGPIKPGKDNAIDAQQHIASAVYAYYVEQLTFWVRMLPQLLYALLPLLALLHFLLIE